MPLDELLRVTKGAHDALLDLEELEELELDEIRAGYTRLAERAREKLRRGESDTDAPEVSR
jgi:low affinity Fe/Cu permease